MSHAKLFAILEGAESVTVPALRGPAPIEGFCWPQGARPGETIELRVNTQGAGRFNAKLGDFAFLRTPLAITDEEVFVGSELQWKMKSDEGFFDGRLEDVFVPSLGCEQWQEHKISIPKKLRSGIYAYRCAKEDRPYDICYIPIVILPNKDTRSDIAVLANTNTWNAYNFWASADNYPGGFARYDTQVAANASVVLSFLRPNPFVFGCAEARPTADQLKQSRHLCRGELWFLTWAREQHGALEEVHVYTDHDLHSGALDLSNYRILIITTHPEYWSMKMYFQTNQFLHNGGSLIYLGGNGIYDKVDFSDDGKLMIAYGNFNQNPRPQLFSFTNVRHPQHKLLGVGAAPGENVMMGNAPYIVKSGNHPLLAGVQNASVGATLGRRGWSGAACGWEFDRLNDAIRPPAFAGHVDLIAEGEPGNNGQMVWYRHFGGGYVFAVGSITFCGSLVKDNDLQAIVETVIRRCRGQ